MARVGAHHLALEMRDRVLKACAASFASAAAIVACVGNDPAPTVVGGGGGGGGRADASTSDSAQGQNEGGASGVSCDRARPFNAASTTTLTALNAAPQGIPMQDQFSPR